MGQPEFQNKLSASGTQHKRDLSQDLKNRTDLLIQSNMTMPSLKATGHKASNSMTAMPGKSGLNS